MIRVCFVCRGNICRSPAAQGVMEHLVARAGLDERLTVESAATEAWHVGEPPDPRVSEVAQRRGITLRLRAALHGARLCALRSRGGGRPAVRHPRAAAGRLRSGSEDRASPPVPTGRGRRSGPCRPALRRRQRRDRHVRPLRERVCGSARVPTDAS
ncbi:MAG: hypothetical protein IPN77_30220 [Sandaracinaceae bacterium]|nr:hypothetical protein [Sandaracinaceae bacterium]